MPWNWELPDWPKFHYDPGRIEQLEKRFLLGIGGALAYLKGIEDSEQTRFIVEILSVEGQKSSLIEGEVLDRGSLQSSIQRHFGLHIPEKRGAEKEAQMAALLCDLYRSFDEPLTDEMLWKWHATLFTTDSGHYRTHEDPMQIVSNRYGSTKVFFEAPPSQRVPQEMGAFIEWFQLSSGPILTKAAIAHLYFESIHPFEDGNGRIGRLLSEKLLSQSVGRPVLIPVSQILEKRKKEYYAALERCNRTLEVQEWVEFFAEVVLQAQKESMRQLCFFIQKAKLLGALSEALNPRQLKVLLRMFEEGPDGFRGGLSAEKYIAITKASRSTATRDLEGLVERGALIKTGELRYTRYWLKLSPC